METGVARSSRLIVSAAAIMVVFFGSFGFTQFTATRQFGFRGRLPGVGCFRAGTTEGPGVQITTDLRPGEFLKPLMPWRVRHAQVDLRSCSCCFPPGLFRWLRVPSSVSVSGISRTPLWRSTSCYCGYTSSTLNRFKDTAANRILNGAKPADLPVEQPHQFDYVVNMKTGKALGIKLPDEIMIRAERFIE